MWRAHLRRTYKWHHLTTRELAEVSAVPLPRQQALRLYDRESTIIKVFERLLGDAGLKRRWEALRPEQMKVPFLAWAFDRVSQAKDMGKRMKQFFAPILQKAEEGG